MADADAQGAGHCALMLDQFEQQVFDARAENNAVNGHKRSHEPVHHSRKSLLQS